jgi:hypothetical protein
VGQENSFSFQNDFLSGIKLHIRKGFLKNIVSLEKSRSLRKKHFQAAAAFAYRRFTAVSFSRILGCKGKALASRRKFKLIDKEREKWSQMFGMNCLWDLVFGSDYLFGRLQLVHETTTLRLQRWGLFPICAASYLFIESPSFQT